MTSKTNTHERFITACQEYLKWQGRFEQAGSDEAGIKARQALLEIKKLCMLRRKEIHESKIERKKLRKGKNGRPQTITKGSYQ